MSVIGKILEDRINAKYAGDFCVTHYSKAIGESRPVGTRRYQTIGEACAAATRLNGCKRYRDDFLFVDAAQFYA